MCIQDPGHWRQGSGKPDSTTTFNKPHHHILTDLDKTDLVEFDRSGERHTDPH